MPFAVTQWGYSPDPREPDFGLIGFNFGQIPPWRWVSKTTFADAPFTALNDDFLWEADTFTSSFVLYKPTVPIPGIFFQNLQFSGTALPQGGPPTFTTSWLCSFRNFFPPPISEGTLKETYEDAIGVRSFAMSGMGTGGPLFPNPLVFTPQKWNADL